MAYITGTARTDQVTQTMRAMDLFVNRAPEFNVNEVFAQASEHTKAALEALYEAQDKFAASELLGARRSELQIAIKEELRLHAIQSGTTADLNAWIRHMQKQYANDGFILAAIAEVQPDLQKEISVLSQIALNGYFDWHNEGDRTELLQRWDNDTWDRFSTSLAGVEDKDGKQLMSFGAHRGVKAQSTGAQTISVDSRHFDSLAKAAERISAGDQVVHAYAVREDGILIDLTAVDKDSLAVDMSQRPDNETSKDAYFRLLRNQLNTLPDVSSDALTYANRLPLAQAQIKQIAMQATQLQAELVEYERVKSASWLGFDCVKKLFNGGRPELEEATVLIIKHSSSPSTAEDVAQYMEAEGSSFKE